jgi:predicted dehydrogenase
MTSKELRIGIIGCGHAAQIHAGRLAGLRAVEIVGLADSDTSAAESLAQTLVETGVAAPATFTDHRELLSVTQPDAVAIFTPHKTHYRPAMDALQAGCHLFIEKPLSTNTQEAADVINLAKGRGKTVAVGHQYRLAPSLTEARRRLEAGTIGPLRLVTATLSQPWLASHQGPEDSWRLDPKLSGGGILADAGDHLIDALLWTTRSTAVEVAAFQDRLHETLDLVTAAALRLSNNVPATFALSGITPGIVFELTFHGERGRLRATDRSLIEWTEDGWEHALRLPDASTTIDADFIAAIRDGQPACCPASEALETVRLLEAIARSAATGQSVRLV